MKDKLFEKVKQYMSVHDMAEAGDCIVAGVSGGADSVCMLHLLVRLQREIPFRLAVVHVNLPLCGCKGRFHSGWRWCM